MWRWRSGRVRTAAGSDGVVTPSDLEGKPLGVRATLVQFSSPYCRSCPATRRMLGELASAANGVVHVDIDAEFHLPLVRRFNVARTPTVLILDGTGRVTRRASGPPHRHEIKAALDEVTKG
jgi:thiol-disulfide isomerase/thioredoxin